MSNTPSGLQTERFVESFTKPKANTSLVYTTEDFVNSTVRNYLNTSSSVDIRIGNGVSFTALTGTTETVVTIGLDAGLGNLNNVDLSGVTSGTSGPYLFYNGTSWVAGSGLSITGTEITDLKNVEGTVKENSVLFSANGTSLFFKEDKTVSIDNLRAAHTRGIVVTKNSSYPYEANIQTRFLHFPTTNTDNSTDFYTVTDPSSGITRKIEKSDIDARQFYYFSTGARESVFDSLQSTNNATGSSGLCYIGNGVYNLNLSNYLSGAGGVLPISRGGTDASGAADARVNLGLSYGPSASTPLTNYLYDIMGFSQPTFRDTISGDNIRLVGTLQNFTTIISHGSCYINTDSNYYYITNPRTGLCYQVLPSTGPGGSVFGIGIPSFTDGTGEFYNTFTSEIRNLNPIGPGSGASVRLTVEDSFINYGTGSGEDGFGLRFGTCTPQVYVVERGEWEEINRLPAVQELTNVTESAPFTDGDFLIYNGSCFQPYQISGAITIGASGVASLTSTTFGVSTIDFGVSPYTINWDDLTGTTASVQTQLDQKLSYTGPVQTEQGILLLNEGSCTNASVITYDTTITPEAPQVPMVLNPSYDDVSFKNIYTSFVGPSPGPTYEKSDITNLETCLLDNSFGTLPYTDGVGTKISLANFMDLITAPTGGIVPGTCANTLQLGVQQLEDYYGIPDQYEHREDFIAVGSSITTGVEPNKKITIRDLLHVPFFSDAAAANAVTGFYRQGALAFFTSQAGTSYLGIATGNANSWYGVSIAATIT